MVTGSGLYAASSIKFNGVSGPLDFVGEAQIQTHVPSGATTGTVSVTTPGGTGTSTAIFTVSTSPPTITSTYPVEAAPTVGVSIQGTHFSGATSLKFNGTPATMWSVNSDTIIGAIIPAGATTGPITVTTPAGTGTSAINFIVAGGAGGDSLPPPPPAAASSGMVAAS